MDSLRFLVRMSDPQAVVPSKAHPSDAGFDVTAIKVLKQVNDVTFFGTGIHIEPPAGYYFLLYPRSSISKTGYSMANSVGVIDASYQGEVIVALRKNEKELRDLELPCRIAQLVPMKTSPMTSIQVNNFFEETSRGEGGFGSTGK